MPTRLVTGLSFVKPNLYASRTDSITFTAGDQTPSVLNGSFFITARSALTILNFDSGEQGQIIHLFSNSGGATTIQNSAGGINITSLIYTVSGADLVTVNTNTGDAVLLNNEMASFIHNGTDWSYLGTRVVDANA